MRAGDAGTGALAAAHAGGEQRIRMQAYLDKFMRVMNQARDLSNGLAMFGARALTDNDERDVHVAVGHTLHTYLQSLFEMPTGDEAQAAWQVKLSAGLPTLRKLHLVLQAEREQGTPISGGVYVQFKMSLKTYLDAMFEELNDASMRSMLTDGVGVNCALHKHFQTVIETQVEAYLEARYTRDGRGLMPETYHPLLVSMGYVFKSCLEGPAIIEQSRKITPREGGLDAFAEQVRSYIAQTKSSAIRHGRDAQDARREVQKQKEDLYAKLKTALLRAHASYGQANPKRHGVFTLHGGKGRDAAQMLWDRTFKTPVAPDRDTILGAMQELLGVIHWALIARTDAKGRKSRVATSHSSMATFVIKELAAIIAPGFNASSFCDLSKAGEQYKAEKYATPLRADDTKTQQLASYDYFSSRFSLVYTKTGPRGSYELAQPTPLALTHALLAHIHKLIPEVKLELVALPSGQAHWAYHASQRRVEADGDGDGHAVPAQPASLEAVGPPGFSSSWYTGEE